MDHYKGNQQLEVIKKKTWELEADSSINFHLAFIAVSNIRSTVPCLVGSLMSDLFKSSRTIRRLLRFCMSPRATGDADIRMLRNTKPSGRQHDAGSSWSHCCVTGNALLCWQIIGSGRRAPYACSAITTSPELLRLAAMLGEADTLIAPSWLQLYTTSSCLCTRHPLVVLVRLMSFEQLGVSAFKTLPNLLTNLNRSSN